MKLIPNLVLFLAAACYGQMKPDNIIGTWGGVISGPDFYREYTFTDKELIVYDDGFGAQRLDYVIVNDSIKTFRDGINKAGYESYRVLSSVNGKELTLLYFDEKTVIVLKKIKTKVDVRKIFDDEKEFMLYIAEFERRSKEH
jgi:hypothetical protein